VAGLLCVVCRGFVDVSGPVSRAHNFPSSIKSTISGPYAATAAYSFVLQRQQHHSCLAAVPPAAADSFAAGVPQQTDGQIDQQSYETLWSDDDIFDAFESDAEISSTAPAAGGEAPAQPSAAHSAAAKAQQQHENVLSHEQQQQHAAVLPPQHHRHQRRFSQQLAGTVLQHHHQQHQHMQQQSGLQQLQPVVRTFHHVHLLQRIAGINSWVAAAAVIQQEHSSLCAEHVALLWGRLTPKLQGQQQAAVGRALRHASAPHGVTAGVPHSAQQGQQLPQQQHQQQQVIQELCRLTAQYACCMEPQALTMTLQGLAAAVAAGRAAVPLVAAGAAGPTAAAPASVRAGHSFGPAPTACGCVQLDRELPELLQQQVLQQAGSCSPYQLAACLSSGQQLGWCCSSSSSSGSSCLSVVEAASQGQLGRLLQAGTLSSMSAAQLLHCLAGCTPARQQAHTAWQPTAAAAVAAVAEPLLQQQSLQASLVVQQLADQACDVLGSLGQQDTPGDLSTSSPLDSPASTANSTTRPPAAAAAAPGATADGAYSSSSHSSQGLGPVLSSEVAAAVCSIQAFAVLQQLPDPDRLEGLLSDLQPHIEAGRLDGEQLLLLLKSCHTLGVEPWPEWLHGCYNSLSDNLHALQPLQLLQLVAVLQHVTNLQPSPELLHRLAKMTAVHSSRYSLQQLASLSSGFKQLEFRPEPYWVKDFFTASTGLLQQQPQQQQRQTRLLRSSSSRSSSSSSQQEVAGMPAAAVPVLVEMLSAVGWLSAASPPAAWLTAMELALLAAASWDAAHLQQQSQQQLVGGAAVDARLPADSAAVVVRVLAQWQHRPSRQLQVVLDNSSLQDQGQRGGQGPGGGGAGSDAEQQQGHAGPSRVATAAADEAAAGAHSPLVNGASSSSGSSNGSSNGSSQSSSRGVLHGASVIRAPENNPPAAAAAAADVDACGPQGEASTPATGGFNNNSTADGPFAAVGPFPTSVPLHHRSRLVFGSTDLEHLSQEVKLVQQQDIELVDSDAAMLLVHLPAQLQSMQRRSSKAKWYRSRLVQLLKGAKGAKGAPALVVL